MARTGPPGQKDPREPSGFFVSNCLTFPNRRQKGAKNFAAWTGGHAVKGVGLDHPHPVRLSQNPHQNPPNLGPIGGGITRGVGFEKTTTRNAKEVMHTNSEKGRGFVTGNT